MFLPPLQCFLGSHIHRIIPEVCCVWSALTSECRRSPEKRKRPLINLQMKSLKPAPGCPLSLVIFLRMGSLFSRNTAIWASLQSKQQFGCAVAKKSGRPPYGFINMHVWTLQGLGVLWNLLCPVRREIFFTSLCPMPVPTAVTISFLICSLQPCLCLIH